MNFNHTVNPARLSVGDSRKTKFLIQNLSLDSGS